MERANLINEIFNGIESLIHNIRKLWLNIRKSLKRKNNV